MRFEKIPMAIAGDERSGRQTEGERHDVRHEFRRVDAEIPRSCATADEITSSSPATVERAVASPPAATSPTIQFGSLA